MNDTTKKIKSNEKSAIRLNITLSQQHQAYFKHSRDFQRKMSEKVYSMLKAKEIIEIQAHSLIIPEQVSLTNGATSGEEKKKVSGVLTFTGRHSLGDRQLKYLPEIKEIIEEFFTEDYLKSHVDALLWEVCRRYKSYIGRNNKLPKSSIKIRDKSMAYKSDIFRLNVETKEVLIKKMTKDKNEPDVLVPYDAEDFYLEKIGLLGFGKSKKLEHLTEAKGGIISFKKNELVLVADKVVTYDKVKTWVGIDINKSPDNWLYFSKKIDGKYNFPKPKDILEIEEYIRSTQKKISKDRSIKSKQRSGLRKKWNKAHARHQKMISDFIFEKLEKLKTSSKSSVGIGIDTVGTGQKNGTFGQDKVIVAAQKFCRANGMAHYFVPTPFTSQRCNKCGNVSKQALRKLIKDKYICVKCSHKCHADLNAARNIAAFAKVLQDSDFEMTGTLNLDYKVKSWEILNDKFKLKKK
ncbi:hypothetical protein CMI37_34445 [Candidatus Pacearchaeota archaeon]|nr:hypothetical protein [Candidatus Pacearchaeota archaeon]|tara:strand:+ start:219 stop:1607 length:1389 start_codon:yes stop_codon:yes gene_type:complete